MTGYNLPPGVNVSDLPGNSDDDGEFEELFEELLKSGASARDIRVQINSCPALLRKVKQMRAIIKRHSLPESEGQDDVGDKKYDQWNASAGKLINKIERRRKA